MNNKFYKYIFIFSITVNIAVAITIGYHWIGKCETGKIYNKDSRHNINFLARKLDLSDSQKKQMEELKKFFKEERRKTHKQLDEKNEALFNLLKQPDSDKEKIKIISDEIASLQSELHKLTTEHILKSKVILNEEQQDKFFKIMKKRLYHRKSNKYGRHRYGN